MCIYIYIYIETYNYTHTRINDFHMTSVCSTVMMPTIETAPRGNSVKSY